MDRRKFLKCAIAAAVVAPIPFVAAKAAWSPKPGSQSDFMNQELDQFLYAGGMGGGASDFNSSLMGLMQSADVKWWRLGPT